MKLLSASAVVAGANSVALADCSLCGGREHGYWNCSNLDYEGYGRSIGYKRPEGTPLTDRDRISIGRIAVDDTDKARVAKFLHTSSSIVSFPTPSSGVTSSETTPQSSNEKPGDSDKINTLKFEREQNLEGSSTAGSVSDREEMERQEAAIKRQAAIKIQRARRAQLADREETERAEAVQHLFGEDNMKALARERDTKELKNMLNERRETARNLNGLGKTLDEKKKESIDLFGARGLEYDAQRRGAEEARSVAEENREKINISEDDKTHIKVRNILDRDQKKEERVARERDREELQSMVADSLAKNRENKREALELRAKDAHLQAHLKRNENALRKELAQQKADQEKARERDRKQLQSMVADSLAKNRENKREALELRAKDAHLQAHLKRNENALRKELAQQEAERQGKIQEHRKNAAARKIAEALRANKERQKAQRQAQIDSDYELAKKLQAEYDAEDAQIRAERRQAQIESDRQLAEQLHAEEVAAQIAADHQLAKETQEKFDEERRVAAMPRQQEEFRQRAVGDSEAVETDRWSLPQMTQDQFKGFNFDSHVYQWQAKRWADQLKDLSIRKVECILWLVGLSYWDLLQDGGETGSTEIYEAVCDVKDLFPKTGPEVKVSPAIMNVYNAFENTSPAVFEGELATLGSRELNGVLYTIAQQYAKLLENGKKAADKKLIALAKAAVEHFDRAWEAEDAEVFEESDAREADNTESAVVKENRQEPAVSATAGVQGIVETEAPETTTWNPPYRLYYAYCGNLKRGLRPSRKSMELFQDKENREQVYQDALSKLTIRRLETIIYLAATAYECRATEGYVDINKAIEDINKAIEDIRNVFPEGRQAQPNARVVNVWNALANMVDKPNDNPISMQPFQKGFTALTRIEQERAFIDMAIAYRKKLREGKRPASMAFVRLADAICKESHSDGFIDGKDNVHPELKFEEFENEAKTATVNSENTNRNADVAEDPETNPWRMPEGVNRALMYDPNIDGTEVLNEGEGLNVQAALQQLTVRQLEAVIGLSAYVYKSRSGVKDAYERVDTAISNEMLEKAGKLWSLILSAPKGDNERLLHVYNALRSASNAKSLTEDLNALPLRKVESFLGIAFLVYNDKLRHGVVPADEAFATATDEVLELLHMNYDEEEAPAEDEIRHGALEDDNRALVEPIEA